MKQVILAGAAAEVVRPAPLLHLCPMHPFTNQERELGQRGQDRSRYPKPSKQQVIFKFPMYINHTDIKMIFVTKSLCVTMSNIFFTFFFATTGQATQNAVSSALMRLVVKDLLPLHIVDSRNFLDYSRTLLGSNQKIGFPSRRTFGRQLHSEYELIKSRVIRSVLLVQA